MATARAIQRRVASTGFLVCADVKNQRADGPMRFWRTTGIQLRTYPPTGGFRGPPLAAIRGLADDVLRECPESSVAFMDAPISRRSRRLTIIYQLMSGFTTPHRPS